MISSDWFSRFSALLKRPLASEADVLKLVYSGITQKTYEHVVLRLEIPKDVIGPETTIRNRLKKSARLNSEESERLLRIARVYAVALDLFGSDKKALEWLHRPARFLPDNPPIAPIDLAVRESGARLLEDKLRRIAYGMF